MQVGVTIRELDEKMMLSHTPGNDACRRRLHRVSRQQRRDRSSKPAGEPQKVENWEAIWRNRGRFPVLFNEVDTSRKSFVAKRGGLPETLHSLDSTLISLPVKMGGLGLLPHTVVAPLA